MRKSLLFLLLVWPWWSTSQSEPKLLWETKGSKWSDTAYDVLQNMQGDLVVAGKSSATFEKGTDVYFGIFNSEGRILKEKKLGYRKDEVVYAILQTFDGGYVMAGYTESEVEGHQGKKDAWLLKVDEQGNWLWDKLLGTMEDDVFYDVVQDEQGRLIATGHFNQQLCLVYFTANGTKINQILYPAAHSEMATALKLTTTQDIIMTGFTTDENGVHELLVLKTFLNGQPQWKKYFPQAQGLDIVEEEGNIWVTGIYKALKEGKNMYLLKLNAFGDKIWSNSYGGRAEDVANAISLSLDKKCFLAGYSYSFAKGARRPKLWLNQLDGFGKEVWKAPFYLGGALSDEAEALVHTTDNGLVIAGSTASNEAQFRDVWVLKMEGEPLPSLEAIPELKIVADNLTDEDGSGFLDPNERGYYTFTLTNHSTTDIYELQGQVKLLSGVFDLAFFSNIRLGYLKAGASKKMYIPIQGGEHVQSGDNQFEITWTAQQRVIAPPFLFNMKSRKKPQPDLKILAHQFELPENQFARKDEPITLWVKIANEGEATAEGVRVKFSLPYKVNSLQQPLEFKLDELHPHTTRELRLTFQAEAVFLENEIQIGCRVTEKTFKFGQEKILVLSLEKPNIAVPMPPHTSDFLTIIWTNPNPNKLKSTVIDWDFQEFKIEAKAKSNQPISAENFTIFVNHQNQIARNGNTMEVVKLQQLNHEGPYHTYTIENTIQLQEGDNQIWIKAKNAAGEDSTGVIEVKYHPAKPDLHLLSIGVPAENLNYTTKDAKDFAEAFQQQEGRLFRQVHTQLLNTTETTKTQNIREKMEDLVFQDIPEEDMVVLFISAHGYDDEGVFRLHASDFNGMHTTYTIDYERDVLDQLKKLKTKTLVFIDACQSGQVSGSKGDIHPMGEKLGAALLQLSQAEKGIRTVVSSSANERSYEDEIWENGAFTEAILAAFDNQNIPLGRENIKADSDQNGWLTLKELSLFLEQYVPFLVQKEKKKAQHPFIDEKVKGEELPIYFFY